MLQWLTDNKDWFFGGLGVALIMSLMKLLGNKITNYINFSMFRRMDDEVEKRVISALKKIIVDNPLIYADVELDLDEVEIYYTTYHKGKNEDGEEFPETWEQISNNRIEQVTSKGFSVPRKEIKKRLTDESDPYKFYMKVPNSPDVIRKYYCRLLEAKHLVTGKWSIDKDSGKWQIWFLLHTEPIHPNSITGAAINHTLINKVFIRNSVYNANKKLQTIT